MKSTLKKSFFLALLAASTSLSAQAGTLKFGDTGNGVDAGSTTWDAGTTADWNNGTSTVGWTDNSDAVFGGTAGTVTVAPGNRIANSLTFNSNGYILNSTSANNGGIAINQGGTVTVASGDTATINSYFYTIGAGGTSSAATTNLIKAGSGTLVLAGVGINGTTPTGTHGDNRPAGQIAITGGTLQLGNGTGWGGYFDNSSFTLSNGSTVVFDYNNNGGDGFNPLANVRGTGNIVLEGYKDGFISMGSTYAFTNTGTTTVAFDTTDQTGSTAYYASLFLQGGGTSLSTSSVLNMVSGNVVLRQAQAVAGLTGTGGYVTTDGSGLTFTINTAAATTTSSAAGIGATNLGFSNAMNLAVTGTGTQVLTGHVSYTGTTSITGGSTLQIGAATDTTSSAINTFNSAVTIGSGSTFVVDGGSVGATLGGGVSLTGAGNFQIGNGSTSFANSLIGLNEASNNITGTTTVNIKSGATWPVGEVFVNSSNSLSASSLLNVVSGGVDLRASVAVAGISGTSAGQIAADRGVPTVTDTLTDNVATGSDTYAGGLYDIAPGSIVGGAGQSQVALTKTGTGTQVLTGNVTYTGATAINNGTLQLGATTDTTTSTINNFNSAVTIASGATLLLDGGSANSTLGNGTSLTGAGNLQIGSGTSSFAGAYTGLNETSNTITGTTTINLKNGGAWPAGMVFIDNANSLSATSLLNMVNGTLDFRSGTSVAGISGSNAATVLGSDGFAPYRPVLTDNVSTGTVTYAGQLVDQVAGSGNNGAEFGLVKTGAGTQVLSGTSSYSGGTTVSGGTLAVSGTIGGTGTTSVSGSGSTLNVTGTYGSSGIMSVGGGGTVQVDQGGPTGKGAITQATINVVGSSATSKAVLTGNGTVGFADPTAINTASINVGAFGVLAPGDANDNSGVANPLIMNSAVGVTLNDGATLSFVLNGTTAGAATGGYSQLNLNVGSQAGNNVVALNGNVNLQLVLNYTPTVGDTFLLTNDSFGEFGTFDELNGVATNLSEGSTFVLGGTTFGITYLGGTQGGDLELTAELPASVPEPSEYVLLLAGLAALGLKLRHSRFNKSAV